jgi:hypothetical protein
LPRSTAALRRARRDAHLLRALALVDTGGRPGLWAQCTALAEEAQRFGADILPAWRVGGAPAQPSALRRELFEASRHGRIDLTPTRMFQLASSRG